MIREQDLKEFLGFVRAGGAWLSVLPSRRSDFERMPLLEELVELAITGVRYRDQAK